MDHRGELGADALDISVNQKVLPKLNGTQQELQETVDDLILFAEKQGWSRTGQKLSRMRTHLIKRGFASWIE